MPTHGHGSAYIWFQLSKPGNKIVFENDAIKIMIVLAIRAVTLILGYFSPSEQHRADGHNGKGQRSLMTTIP